MLLSMFVTASIDSDADNSKNEPEYLEEIGNEV